MRALLAVIPCLLCKLPFENFIFEYFCKTEHNSRSKNFWSMIVYIPYVNIMLKIVSIRSDKYLIFFSYLGNLYFDSRCIVPQIVDLKTAYH